VLKAQILGAATAATRGKLKKFLNPEDVAWLGGVHSNPDDERVQRMFRTHRNDLENLLPFFISGTLYLASGGSVMFGAAYFGIFLIARYTYSYAYLASRPRLRRDSYTVGWLVTILMGVHAAWNAISVVLK
jgi:uncharacterized MAPEG superfamily protein